MILLDDKTPTLLTATALENAKVPDQPVDEFSKTLATTDSITQSISDSLKNMDLNDLKGVVTGENTILRDGMKALTEMTVSFVPKLLIAILILWVGMKLAKMLKKIILRGLERRNAEPSLKSFLGSLVDVLLKAMIIIMAMDVVGIKATSFIALLGAMGLAIGMALQGTLQNFAGGVIILLMKPFKVGDYIECGVYKGYIQEIRIFHTFMRPFNGRTIIIPNSELSNKSLINHTKEEIIRLDLMASVAYGSDLDQVRDVLMQVINEDPLVLHDPKPPVVAVSDLAESSVNFSMWIWVRTDDYWTVWMRMRENIYKALYRNNISIPFPQVDIHLHHPASDPGSPAPSSSSNMPQTVNPAEPYPQPSRQ